MGKLIVTEFISLDGVFEDPGGSEGTKLGPWTFGFNRGSEGDAFKMDELKNSDASLLGFKTYQGFAAAWPGRTGAFADILNNQPKYVVSDKPTTLEWNNSHIILAENLKDEVEKLKKQFSKNILVAGSGSVVKALMENDLIDQYNLMVFPVVLGSGRRLFNELAKRVTLKLIESKPVGPDGVMILIYKPK